MVCPSCGRDNPADANFCGGCGNALPREEPCPSCGRRNPSDLRFCRGCGAALAAAEDAAAPDANGDAPSGDGQPVRRRPGGVHERPPAAPDDAPRSLAGGRYAIRSFLGEGGRKRVYLARDTELDRQVAVALVKTDGVEEAVRMRIRREAQAMARLGDHPHVVTVHDIGEEDGVTYIVSQYMAGGSLDRRLEQAEDGRLDPAEAISIAESVCRALDHAHGNGIIHRDLKPANVWLTGEGTAKLGDFGLAFSLDRSRFTQAGMIVGTVTYMAPEQALGEPPDACGDLYSLGAMLYEMVTGRPPFLGDDVISVISQHANAEPVAPSWHVEDVFPALEELILRLLEKSSADRPATAAEVLDALAAASRAEERERKDSLSHAQNPIGAVAAGVFVGREREVDRLRGALEDALAGRGRITVLSGEPGIGKTRTAQELGTYAGLRDAHVAIGRCYEGEGSPAYWPWLQIARTLINYREPGAVAEEGGPGATDIADVVRELQSRIPNLEAGGSLDPEQARFRFFDGIATYLKDTAAQHPLVLILDDLHWADEPSLRLLQFVARELQGTPILLLGTYRDVELGREHPLSQVLADLTREGLADRILLRGLSQADVARYIEVSASVRPRHALVAAIHAETEGNPFFVTEVVSLLASEGRIDGTLDQSELRLLIPEGVKEVVGRRLDRLSDECNEVLKSASVVGREFGLEVLGRVTGMPRDRLLELLDEAVGARVVSEDRDRIGRFTFSHALVRDTLYGELGVTARVRLHLQVADAIEATFGPDLAGHNSELAHHYLQAQSLGKAVSYSIKAAKRSVEGMAYEAGAKLYDQALQALELRSPGEHHDRCRLLVALGDAWSRAGEGEKAKARFREAADLAKRLGANEELGQAALGLANLVEIGTVDRDLIALLEEALDRLPQEDSEMRARLLGKLGKTVYYASTERRERLTREAVEMARPLDDPATLAVVLHDRHFAMWGLENVEGRLDAATEMIDAAERAGDHELAVEGIGLRLLDLLELGDVAGVDEEIERYSRGAAELRQPAYQRLATLRKAMRANYAGEFEKVEPLLQKDSIQAARHGHDPNILQAWGIVMFELRRRQGRVEDLESSLREFVEQYPAVPAWRCGLVALKVELRDEAAARREFERLAEDDFAGIPQDANFLISVALLAEAVKFLGDGRRAAVLYDLLLPYAERLVVVGAGFSCVGSASRYLGLLAATLGRYDVAERHFQEAMRMNEATHGFPQLALTRQDLAEMLAERDEEGDDERAVELVGQALETASSLGMRLLVERALALKVRLQGLEAVDVSTSIDSVMTAVEEERPDLRGHTSVDGTVTILFSDIEGSTVLTERLGDRRWLELLRAHNAIVRAEIEAHDGYEVKSQGDGFMIAFADARRAIDCAIAIQHALAERDVEQPDEPIRVRIGLHTGEAIRDRDDFFGRNVILAARIAAQAAGGEILVSSPLKELTENGGGIEFGKARELELKGLSGRHVVHPVAWEPAGATAGR